MNFTILAHDTMQPHVHTDSGYILLVPIVILGLLIAVAITVRFFQKKNKHL
jgi:hypothetical protein